MNMHAMIVNLPAHELLRQPQTARRVRRVPELLDPQQHILQRMPARHPVKPAAHGKPRHRNLLVAQPLHRLRGNLDISEKRHVADIHHAHLLHQPVLFLHLQHRIVAADAIARRIKIKRALFVARRDQPAGRGGRAGRARRRGVALPGRPKLSSPSGSTASASHRANKPARANSARTSANRRAAAGSAPSRRPAPRRSWQ